MLVSYDFKSFYPQAKASINSLNNSMYCNFMWAGRVLDSLIILGSARLPMLCSSTFVSTGSILGSLATLLKSKRCSKGVRPLGIVSLLHCKTSKSSWSALSINSASKGFSQWFISAECVISTYGFCSIYKQFSLWLLSDIGIEKSFSDFKKSSMCFLESNTYHWSSLSGTTSLCFTFTLSCSFISGIWQLLALKASSFARWFSALGMKTS